MEVLAVLDLEVVVVCVVIWLAAASVYVVFWVVIHNNRIIYLNFKAAFINQLLKLVIKRGLHLFSNEYVKSI